MSDAAPYTEAHGRLALRDHIYEKAAAARDRYAALSAGTLSVLLQDRSVVRYPLRLNFDISPLEPGELAFLQQLGEHPADGFCLYLHPALERDARLPLVVAYYIPSVNYGEIVSSAEAELFGATLTASSLETYYEALCALSDALAGN